MDEYELTAKYNIAETCCASISVDELISVSDKKDSKVADILDPSTVLNYGEIRGTTPLRQNLSRLYSSKVGTPLSHENILITPGAIAANYLVFYSLLGKGDHVICHYPTYQQLYSVPESLGAEVDLWKSDPNNKWLPNFDELESLVKDNTKMIILNNPQNPTGAVLPKSLLLKMIALAESKNITILSDEVYRPLFHGITPIDPDFPPSILSLGYTNTIATGSLSKAYSLAGIRVGWIASRNRDFIEQCQIARDYTTLSVSKIDQKVAEFALSPDTVHGLLGRNIQLAKANLEILDRFVLKHDEYCSYTKPVAGTTAFVKFEREGKAVDAAALCKAVQEKTGVMFLPGDVGFGEQFKGYVRIGYCNQTQIVKEGFEELRKFMRREVDEVPLAE
jgi:aspartate/methionine/tyrosine aminotransferase